RLEAAAAARAAAKAESEARARARAYAQARVAKANARLTALLAERARFALPADHDAKAATLERALAQTVAAAEKTEAERVAAEKEASEAERGERAAFDPMRKAEAKAGEIAAEVRALEKLAAQTANQKFPAVLARIKARRGYERAVGAALGDDAGAALDAAAPHRWAGRRVSEAIAWPSGAEPLAAYVDAPPELAARLARCAIVDRAAGLTLMAHLPPSARLVSREGDLWRWDGLVREADAASLAAAARLEQQNRLEQAKTDREAAEALMLAAQRAWETARTARERAEARLKVARAAAPAAAAAVLQARAAQERHTGEVERAASLLAASAAQEAALRAEIEEASAAAGAENMAAGAHDESAIAALRTETEAARAAAAEARAALAALERERAARTARNAYLRGELDAWALRRARAAARLGEIAQAQAQARTARAAAAAAPAVAREQLARLAEEAAAAERRLAAAGEALAAAENRARETARAARTAEALHAQEREARASAEARFEAGERRLADILAQARDHIGAPVEDLPRRAGDLLTTPLAQGPLADIERRADRLRADREAAGPVNLRAEEELAETQARLETLQAEKADVAAAVAKLRRAIGELNAEGRARLVAAFEVVNGHFGALFATLFEGGEAHLKLIEPESGEGDPLAAGLEIFASPPGKKLSVLSLMSGGEQALTAAALIFAVFLANPAPLCVLDEVDAPLDDANVERFCAMLDAMRKRTETRFLVITHNPMTMARMDRLYGVTMAERGVSQLVSVDLQRAAELAAA
ncbi:MAG: chromosome segregation protein SMC, partial [Hyphomonadaceae bacterium]